MPKCDACRADGASQRCTNCQGCWSCDRACAKRFWPTHKKFCTDDPALKPHVPIELAIERALAKAPRMIEPPPENATCYICLETEGPQNGDKVMRACACRGPSAGFAHVDCLAEMASRNEWIVVGGGDKLSRWLFCQTCRAVYEGALSLELTRRWWHRVRGNRPSDAKLQALAIMAAKLRHQNELDAASRLNQDSTRGLARTNPDMLLRHDIMRAGGLFETRRYREALEILTRLRPSAERQTDLMLRANYASLFAHTLTNMGRLRDALPFAVEAVELATEADGPESQMTLACAQLRVHVLAGLGRVGEAKAALARVLATQTRVLGADHPDTLRTKQSLSALEA